MNTSSVILVCTCIGLVLLLPNSKAFANAEDDAKWQRMLEHVRLNNNNVIDNNKNNHVDKATDYEISDKVLTSKKDISLTNKKINLFKKIIKFEQQKLTATIYTIDKNNQQLILADTRVEPFKNIQSSIKDIYTDSLNDFEFALPRLQKTVKAASEAVGYYDLHVRFSQTDEDKNNVNVIIEYLDEPVIVNNRVVDIRGSAKDLPAFTAMKNELKPLKGQVFHHGEYNASKALIENKSKQLGFFDARWLNKSADIILPDNTVDVDLIYDTGQGYQFDEVVFFTIDNNTGNITTDPNKLPVKLELLQTLVGFKAGDSYNKRKINQLRNNLTATRYFNQLKVEAVLPNTDTTNNTRLDNQQDPAVDIGLIAFTDPSIKDIEQLSIKQLHSKGLHTNNNNNQQNNQFDGTASNILTTLINGDDHYEEQLASIVFSVNDSTKNKYQAIKRKAEGLLLIPEDRIAKKADKKTKTPLGRVSDSISSLAKDIFPDDDTSNDIPPTFTNKHTPAMVKQSKKVPLYVFVATNKPYDAQVGLGYGTDKGFRLTSKLKNTLVNKQGYQAGVVAELSATDKKLAFNANRPWKHPLNDRLNAGISYEQKVINQTDNKHWKTDSILANLGRNKNSDTGWNKHYGLKYRYDRLTIGEDMKVSNQDILPIQFIGSDSDQQALSMRASLSKTTADNLANPTQGYKQLYSLETGVSSPSLDTKFTIARAGASGIYSFGKDNKHQTIGKVNAGYMWSDDFKTVPYSLRFFSGGDQSIRGYDYNSLSPVQNNYLTGGQALATASAEYNYEFAKGLRGAVFADVGNAYDKDFTTPTKVGLGFGIRWASPIGPVRLDIGSGITEQSIPVRLHLFIGSPL